MYILFFFGLFLNNTASCSLFDEILLERQHHGGHYVGNRPDNHIAYILASGETGRCTQRLLCTSAGEPSRFFRREDVCCPSK